MDTKELQVIEKAVDRNSNTSMWILITFACCVLSCSIIYNRIEVRKKELRDAIQNEKLFRRKIWAMSTHYHTSQGARFTREDAESIFDVNPALNRPDFPRRDASELIVPFWTAGEYEEFVTALKSCSNPSEVIDEYRERSDSPMPSTSPRGATDGQ